MATKKECSTAAKRLASKKTPYDAKPKAGKTLASCKKKTKKKK